MTLRTKLLSTAAGLHPAQLTRLELKLDPATAVLDRWRLYRIHHFAVVGDAWSELTQQVTRDTWPGHVAHLGGVAGGVYRDPRQRGQDALDCADGQQGTVVNMTTLLANL